jgi:hypothetical protein
MSAGRPREKCTRCGNALPVLSREHRDPFCSSTCAKATHGVRDRCELDPHGRGQPKKKRQPGGDLDMVRGHQRLLQRVGGIPIPLPGEDERTS